MALPPTPYPLRTRLDKRRSRLLRGRRAVEGAAGFTALAAAFALISPVPAVTCAVIAAFLALMAIEAGLPWED